ncbi:hypothetical protein [Azorhizobium doebereinerae]|uniref:hypothetical protein n=1 Tax=Azorhizobium doebereinerae TaxID=281091 RepID=UPI0004065483|nr:hypothetical protein [Azorhizobium doebereinerae]
MTLHVGTLKEVDTRPLRAPRRSPNWGAFLARPLCLADGETVLERLWDAADVLHAKGLPCAAFHLSQSTLDTAAVTGARSDIRDATDHLEHYLRHRALM